MFAYIVTGAATPSSGSHLLLSSQKPSVVPCHKGEKWQLEDSFLTHRKIDVSFCTFQFKLVGRSPFSASGSQPTTVALRSGEESWAAHKPDRC